MTEEADLLKRRGRKVTLDPIIYPAEAGRVYVIEKAEPARRRGAMVDVFLTLEGRMPPRPIRESETRPAPATSSMEKPIMASSTPSDRLDLFAKDLQKKKPGLRYADAVVEASAHLGPDVEAYQRLHRGIEEEPLSDDAAIRPASYALAAEVKRRMEADSLLTVETATELVLASRMAADAPPASTPMSLSVTARTGEGFDALAMRLAAERGMSLRDAVHQVGVTHPHLAQAR